MFLKKYIFVLLGILLYSTMNAQVTIGSSLKPNNGAILDLKETDELGVNSTKGLLMPRVALQKKSELEPLVSGVATEGQKKDHIGLLLYNTSTIVLENLCPGLYVWNANEWSRLYEECVDNTSDLSLSANSILVDADGFDKQDSNLGIMQITYSSSKPVSVTTADDWYTIKHLASNNKVEVDISPNNGVGRTGLFTLTDGVASLDVAINQESLDWSLVATPSIIAASGGVVNVSISSNSTRRSVLTRNVQNSSWVTINDANTLSPSISIAPNVSATQRDATFIVELSPLISSQGKFSLGATKSQGFEIQQQARPASDLIVSTTSVAVDVDGFNKLNASQGVFGFTYTSSNPVDVSTSDVWLTLNHASNTQTVSVDAAPSNTIGRTGTITLTDGTTVKTVSVVQDGLSFSASASPTTVAASGGTSTVYVTNNSTRRGVYTTSYNSWASVGSPASLQPSVSVANNTTTDSRTAMFITTLATLSSSYGKVGLGASLSRQSSITQDGAVPVPTTGRWSYNDHTQAGPETTDSPRVLKSPGAYQNVEIRCTELFYLVDAPLAYLEIQASGGATYSGMQIRNDPAIGNYVTFSSLAGPKNSSVTITFIGKGNHRAYIFAYVFY